jgi:hypothetical protein
VHDSLDHSVYRKLNTHESASNQASHHNPVDEKTVLTTLAHTIRTICDSNKLHTKIEVHKNMFQMPNLSGLPPTITQQIPHRTANVCGLSATHCTTNSWVMVKRIIKMVSSTSTKISSFLWPTKMSYLWTHQECTALLKAQPCTECSKSRFTKSQI